MVFAGMPMGVAYAQDAPITVAIKTALGSAPNWLAIDKQIGANKAVVAVFDIKLVKIQEMINTALKSKKGEAWCPSKSIIERAMIAPAPVVSSAFANARVPPNRKIVCESMAW